MHPTTKAALETVTKWRRAFMNWQLGDKPRDDPEACAVVEHREVTIMLRVESSALANLLVKKGVFTVDEFEAQLAVEAMHLSKMLEKAFPGYSAHIDGLHVDPSTGSSTFAILHRTPEK